MQADHLPLECPRSVSAPVDDAHPLRERLLALMDQKDHWAWPAFTKAGLSKPQLLVHFRHEYQTYVRDFPVLLARALGQGPPSDVRAALAENIFEEQTGKLSLGRSHPALFLEMMDGLGFKRDALETQTPPLETEAHAYRAFLDRISAASPWIVAVATLTIFVEGSVNERAELMGQRKHAPMNEAIAAHPLVRFYGCPAEHMSLVRAHRAVESGHRADAWRMVLSYTPRDGELSETIVRTVARALELWLAYRDGVVRAMGVAPQSA